MKTAYALAACAALAGCAASNPPALPADHPPAADLVCADEPSIDIFEARDPTGLSWDKAVREAGQNCRDALTRVCRWHYERGDKEVIC